MNNTPSLLRTSLLALGSALALAVTSAASAGDQIALQPLADKAAALPVTVSFGKGTPGENGGPYAATVKNTSASALKVSATIVWSVQSHNRAKTLNLPAHEIAAGGTWVINDLAVEDLVKLSADGFATLEVKVPPGKSAK